MQYVKLFLGRLKRPDVLSSNCQPHGKEGNVGNFASCVQVRVSILEVS